MKMKTLGTSIALFGAVGVFTGVVIDPIFFDSVMIDPLAIYLIYAGFDFRKGERTSVKWPAIWFGYYSILSASGIIRAFLAPERMNIGKYALSPGWQANTTAAVLLLALAWSIMNLSGLLKSRRMGIAEQPAGAVTQESAQSAAP